MSKKTSMLTGLFKRYGVKGLLLHASIKYKKKQLAVFNYPGEFKHPVYLRTDSSDYSTFREVILGKGYEFNPKLNPTVIVDCGANIGLTSVYFKNKYPEATIIAVEPEKDNFDVLAKNMENYSRVVLYNNGIWNKTVMLKVENIGLSNWGFIVTETQETGPGTVPAISIKEIMVQNNLAHIDILKIDIEGSEKELFEADYDYWLSKTKIVIIELHDRVRKGASRSFFSALSKYDFELFIKGQNIFCYLQH